jgi:HAD superfamily hydrolase (TIGR01509 family)
MDRQPLRAVLLDNNGTCFDDLHVAYGSVRAIMAHWNVPTPSLRQFRDEISSHFADWYRNHGIPGTVTDAQMNAVRETYYAEHGHTARYRPGVLEFLLLCRERGLKTAMVSAEIGSVLIASLHRERLEAYFDRIEAEARPKTPALVRTLVALGVMPEQAVYVDDSAEGIRSAKSIGMRTIGFIHPTSYASEDRICAVGPDATVRDFDSLPYTILSWMS